MIAIFSRCRRSSGFQNWKRRTEALSWSLKMRKMQLNASNTNDANTCSFLRTQVLWSARTAKAVAGFTVRGFLDLLRYWKECKCLCKKNDEIMRSKCVMQRAVEESVVNIADKPSEALKHWKKSEQSVWVQNFLLLVSLAGSKVTWYTRDRRFHMIEVLSAVSGEPVAVVNAQEFEGQPVKVLKKCLEAQTGLPRFRQRLLSAGGEEITGNSISLSHDLQLLLLEYLPPDAEQDEKLAVACSDNKAEEVEKLLCQPRNPKRQNKVWWQDSVALCSGKWQLGLCTVATRSRCRERSKGKRQSTFAPCSFKWTYRNGSGPAGERCWERCNRKIWSHTLALGSQQRSQWGGPCAAGQWGCEGPGDGWRSHASAHCSWIWSLGSCAAFAWCWCWDRATHSRRTRHDASTLGSLRWPLESCSLVVRGWLWQTQDQQTIWRDAFAARLERGPRWSCIPPSWVEMSASGT